ncbi:MAG: hypothetical protein HFE57_08390 [Firmicutes bacterium]|jgi:ERCC4-type nuclease|nr:hypothetical protein [Bacillota bacterium]
MRYHYTESEIKQLLKQIVILVDTREKENRHILDFFESKNIKYKEKKLFVGDYSFFVEKNQELNIERDLYFDDVICIERKASLDELAGNFTADRDRFESEMLRGNKLRKFLLIENEQGYNDIINHNYRSQYAPKSYLGTLFSFQSRYNLDINFIRKELSGNFIFSSIYYYFRNYLLYS